MFDNPNQQEAFYHSLLLYREKIPQGSAKGDIILRQYLSESKTFEEIIKKRNIQTAIKGDKTLEQIVKQIKSINLNFRILTVNDEQFPKSMKTNSNASPVLYTCGNLDFLKEKSIAVVGTRELVDELDVEEAQNVLRRLLRKDYLIVSGLAEGCDTIAHKYAVNNKGKTIAVLGTPINKYYPIDNQELQNKIADEHLLISQYAIGLRTFPQYFAYRNKTTVLLSSEGVVVIRAGDSSGTQYAIKECIGQNKPLYVLENNLHQNYKWVKKYKIIVPNKSGDKK